VADRVDVALLVHRLRRDLQVAVAPDDVLEDPAGALVLLERAGDRLDRAGGDVVPLAHEVRDLRDDGAAHLDLLVGPVECEHVAAEEDVRLEGDLERLHDRVARARELGGDLVGELDLRPRH
jgi:hypothetical protein